MSLRLPTGGLTVLLGPSVQRRRLMNRLDDDGGRADDGRAARVRRLWVRSATPVAERLAAIEAVRRDAPAIVLADRLTDGLGARDRAAVLSALRATAADGPAVLVDDVDPVAALAAADDALRLDGDGGISPVSLSEPDYLAS